MKQGTKSVRTGARLSMCLFLALFLSSSLPGLTRAFVVAPTTTMFQKQGLLGNRANKSVLLQVAELDSLMNVASSATSSLDHATTSSLLSASPVLESLGSLVTKIAQQGGPPAMAAAVAISDSVPLLPSQPISVVAGALFGFPTGLLAVVVGQTIATAFALILGRQLGSNILDWLGRENGEKVKKVLEELGLDATADYQKVFTTILVARQSPVLPFSLGNYMVGAATSGTCASQDLRQDDKVSNGWDSAVIAK